MNTPAARTSWAAAKAAYLAARYQEAIVHGEAVISVWKKAGEPPSDAMVVQHFWLNTNVRLVQLIAC